MSGSSVAGVDGVDRYPTRLDGDGPVVLGQRTDPVVHGGGPGPLDAAAVSSYEEDGFLVLPAHVGPSEVAELDADLRTLADRADPSRPEVVIEPEGHEVRSVFAVHEGSGPLADLARDPRLVDVARQLLGSEVYVHQSRVNLKPGFRGREFYWHSDFETWHAEDGMPAPRALSCSVTLTDNHGWNGPLLAIAGSHRWFVPCRGRTPERHHEESLRRQRYGTPDDASLAALWRQGRVAECTGPAGTVVFFDSNLMHGSNSNISPAPRRNVFIVYNSVENRLVEPFGAAEPRPEHIATRAGMPPLPPRR